jgi:bifunctional non-homologous end joining protein LigD
MVRPTSNGFEYYYKNKTARYSMSVIKSNRFVFTEGSSDKEYNVQLVKDGAGYQVPFQFGRRNGTLQNGSKTTSPVSLEEAEKIYQRVLKERAGKGYVADGTSKDFVPVPKTKETMGYVPQLLNEITLEQVNEFMTDDNYCFQEKKDGERRLADKKNADCRGGNKKGVCVPLPSKIANNLSKFEDIELDGEIIGEVLYVFDILRHEGADCKTLAYKNRLATLGKCKFGPSIVVVDTAYSTKDKKAMFARLLADEAEGVVVKDLRSKYSSGRPNSGGAALKYKYYATATCRVSMKTPSKRSVQVSVLVDGVFEDVGAVTIPANYEVPQVGELVEVRYLYAYKGGSLYQPTYLGPRTDVDESDAKVEQLKYKQGS